MTLTFVEFLQLATSTGALSMGVGVFRWAMAMEKRLTIMETRCPKVNANQTPC